MNTSADDLSHYFLWAGIIPEYFNMSRNQKKKAKKRYKKMNDEIKVMNPVETVLVQCLRHSNQLKNSLPCAYNKKEKAMDNMYTEDAEKRCYLRRRIEDISYQKDAQLEKAYGLVDDDAPRTPQEYVDRIKSGMVTYPTDEEFTKMANGWNPVKPGNTFRWRDPAMKEDQAGYRKALSEFHDSTTPVYDTIAVLDPKDALAAVQEFEKATLH